MADRPDDFDQRWAEMVAELTSDPEAGDDLRQDGPRNGPEEDPPPEQPDGRLGVGEPGRGDAAGDHPAGRGGLPCSDEHRSALEDGLAALFEPLRRIDPGPEPRGAPGADESGGTPGTRAPGGEAPDAFVDNWEDEGHFIPPPPPEFPAGTPLKRLAWAGTLGGPATLAFIALTGWDAPKAVGIGAGLAFVAGFVTLVWQLPESREDGWDDGARL